MSILPDLGRVPPITIGTRLRIAREWRGLEQSEMAEVLGVSRTTVSNYEREYTLPRKLVINAWAAACDVDVEWLKTGRAQEDSDPNNGGPLSASEKITIGYLAQDNVIRLTFDPELKESAA